LPLSKAQKQMLAEVICDVIENIVSDNNYTLPDATTETIGGVKQAADVAILETTDDITNVISTVNTLINNLKAAGIIVNS
jgi:hypothetical protein